MYDRENPPRLPASAFMPNDQVIAEDNGDKFSGIVVGPHDKDSIVVRFSGVKYAPGVTGNIVATELLRLWPARLHYHMCKQCGIIPANTPFEQPQVLVE